MKNDIAVVGLGYIGLPTASMFASHGKNVVGVDVVERVVDTINRGEIHIEEPGLAPLVADVVRKGRLRASVRMVAADVYVIAVPTPFRRTPTNPKAPDLTYVEAASRAIASVVTDGDLVILESTSPVGTTEKVRNWIAEELVKNGRDCLVRVEAVLFAHCPERILPGQMLSELIKNDRICGGLTAAAADAARNLYNTFCKGEIFTTDARTAEMCKLTENASRDAGIAFANELSLICERLDIDVWELIRLANRHPRVKILQPGPGVGGHCIAVDPWFIVDSAPDLARLIRTSREINDDKPFRVLESIRQKANEVESPVIACLGLAFKADVDDLRESPALEIVEHLVREKIGRVLIVEPHIDKVPDSIGGGKVELRELGAAIAEANIVVVLVNHREFLNIDKSLILNKTVIDTRGIWR